MERRLPAGGPPASSRLSASNARANASRVAGRSGRVSRAVLRLAAGSHRLPSLGLGCVLAPMRIHFVGADLEENLGLGILAAVAERAGHRAKIVAFNDLSEIDEAVRRAM